MMQIKQEWINYNYSYNYNLFRIFSLTDKFTDGSGFIELPSQLKSFICQLNEERNKILIYLLLRIFFLLAEFERFPKCDEIMVVV